MQAEERVPGQGEADGEAEGHLLGAHLRVQDEALESVRAEPAPEPALEGPGPARRSWVGGGSRGGSAGEMVEAAVREGPQATFIIVEKRRLPPAPRRNPLGSEGVPGCAPARPGAGRTRSSGRSPRLPARCPRPRPGSRTTLRPAASARLRRSRLRPSEMSMQACTWGMAARRGPRPRLGARVQVRPQVRVRRRRVPAQPRPAACAGRAGSPPVPGPRTAGPRLPGRPGAASVRAAEGGDAQAQAPGPAHRVAAQDRHPGVPRPPRARPSRNRSSQPGSRSRPRARVRVKPVRPAI